MMYTIGAWQFDPNTGALRQNGVEKSLEDRSARVLEILCRRRGEAVSKGELIEEVWQGRSVSPNSVAIVIGDLRGALGDSTSEPAHIITVGKRGYRLSPAPQDVEPETDTSRSRLRRPLLAYATALILVAATAAAIRAREGAPVDLIVVPALNDTGQARYDDLARSLTAVVTDRAARFRGVRVLSADNRALSAARGISLNPRLIIWNGAPELAVTATDASNRSVLWSTFATGRSGNLARETATKLDALQGRIDRFDK